MQINASILLEEGEEAQGTLDELADAILLAVGGDAENDYCVVSVMQPPVTPGVAGTPPEPPSLPTE
jgi:hypothetical protein